MRIPRWISWQYDIRFYAITLSIILSLIRYAYQQPINLDGILYLNAASVYLSQGFNAAMAIYNWPLYSILIAEFSSLFQIPALDAAHVLDTSLIAGAVAIFITLVRELGGSLRVQRYAALIILVYPIFIDLRIMLIREFGYLCFALLSVLYLMRYARKTQWSDVLLWGGAITVASLFRPEGFVLQIFAPLLVLFLPANSFMERIKKFLKLYTFNLAIVTGILLWLIFNPTQSMHELGRLNDVFLILSHGLSYISQFLQHNNELLSEIIGRQTPLFFLGGTTTIFLISWLGALTPLFACLSFYALKKKLILTDNRNLIIIYGYCIINFIILLSFIFQRLFLTERYCLLLNLLLMLAVPFALESLQQQWQEKLTRRWYQSLLIGGVYLWLAGMSLNAVMYVGPSKFYITEAGEWIQQSTPKDSRFYINDAKLIYYANRPGTQYPEDFTPHSDQIKVSALENIALEQYEYIALVILKKQQAQAEAILANLPLVKLRSFYSNRGDEIAVLQVIK